MESILLQIKDLQQRLQKLEEDVRAEQKNHRLEIFFLKYGEQATKVMEAYKNTVLDCCYQGGRGYKIWIPSYHYTHHLVVHPDKYKDCQPTDKDLDAYYAVYGENMKVTQHTHVEIWGN